MKCKSKDALIWCEQKSEGCVDELEFRLHQRLKRIRAPTALRWWRPSFRLSRTRTRSSKTCTHTSGRTRTLNWKLWCLALVCWPSPRPLSLPPPPPHSKILISKQKIIDLFPRIEKTLENIKDADTTVMQMQTKRQREFWHLLKIACVSEPSVLIQTPKTGWSSFRFLSSSCCFNPPR